MSGEKPVGIIVVLSVLALAIAPVHAQSRSSETAPEKLQYPPLAKTESEKRILATINDAVKAGELYANVPAIDGKMLRVLTESTNAKHVLEIGTSTGISGLWFLLALQNTGVDSPLWKSIRDGRHWRGPTFRKRV